MKTRLICILLICAFTTCIPLSSCDQETSADIGSEQNTDESNADVPTQTQFIDTPQWAAETLTFVSEKGLMVGVDSNRFDSQSIITKKEVAATLYRMAGSPEEIPTKCSAGFTPYYTDLQDTSIWYRNAALWCLNNEIIPVDSLSLPGFRDTYRFDADDIMTRSDIVYYLYRFGLEYLQCIDAVGEFVDGAYTRGDVGTWEEFLEHNFIDVDTRFKRSGNPTPWKWAVKQGIIFGYDDNSLRPNNCVTRAEFAAIITRFVKHYDHE